MHRLLLRASGRPLQKLSKDDLLWRQAGLGSSVTTSLGPRLEGLGSVPALNVDLVRLAALVFFCDRTVKRPRMLRRDFEIEVAVSDPALWAPHGDRLAALLALLTGDSWRLSWAGRQEPALAELAELGERDVCLLFSGGADSACGALAAYAADLRTLAVSHSDSPTTVAQQNRALGAYEAELGGALSQVSWRFGRRDNQVGSDRKFGEEPSRRSRSLLFIALGAAVSAAGGGELWIAENGYTSLNPPLMPESGGALSTRTTHPALLRGLAEVLVEVGIDLAMSNVFAEKTKGEMFAEAREAIGATKASNLLSATHSCGKSSQGWKGVDPQTHCGVCLGCLVRRGAFITAGLDDRTTYIEEQLSAARRKEWLSPARRATYSALQDRLRIGFGEEDVLDLGLPDDADLDAALALMRKGLDELGAVEIR
jgi:hypothetical protein